MKQTDIYSRLLNGFIVIFGFWTIYCHLIVYNSGSFNTLVSFCFIPLIFSGIFFYYITKLENKNLFETETEYRYGKSKIPIYLKIICAAIIVLIYWQTKSFLLFWVLSIIFLGVNLIDGSPTSTFDPKIDELSNKKTKWIVAGLILLAVIITLTAHRSDIDDVLYLNMMVTSIDFPDKPLLSFDGMYGEEGLPLMGIYYRAHSYQLLVALISFILKVPKELFYYILFPGIFAAYIIITHWLVLKKFCRKSALPGLILTFIILLVWGDQHYNYGNWAFVRIFQGKSVLISIFIPAILYYAKQYIDNPNIKNWLYLMLVQIAALGFSSSGMIVATISSGIILLTSWRPNMANTNLLYFHLDTNISQ